MSSKTTPESPLPIRTVLQMVGGWIGRLGTVWVEGEITDLSTRGGTVFLTLRDPVANVSARVTAPRGVYEATVPRPANGSRVVLHVKPDFWVNRGSFAFTALEMRPVGVGEMMVRLERPRRCWPPKGSSTPTGSGGCRSCRARSGSSAGVSRRPSATCWKTRAGAGLRCGSRSRKWPSRGRTRWPR